MSVTRSLPQVTPLGDQLRDVVRLLNYYKDMCMPNVS